MQFQKLCKETFSFPKDHLSISGLNHKNDWLQINIQINNLMFTLKEKISDQKNPQSYPLFYYFPLSPFSSFFDSFRG